MKQQANILVVDDNKDLLNTFALILKRKGYTVDTAEDGIQALEKFSAQHFDIVLMDVIMPGLNGIETLHRMRENNTSSKIILMTAYCEEEQLKKALDEGADGTLYKPVNLAKLMEIIGSVAQNPSILVVDDDDDFRFSMSQMLEKQDYRVATAINGEDAIRIAKQKAINIAFVDIKMKVMDGITTSIKLKEIYPDIVIVLMTGYRDEVRSMVEEAKGKGVAKCLYKPFRMADLKDAVNQAI